MAAPVPRDCPCFSGRRYVQCCAPFHRGEREAETPEALMRSRFSAFALGLGVYLVRTLSEDHPDRALPVVELSRELSRVRQRQRFMGLDVVFASQEGQAGEVLFLARLFERGKDRSLAELSDFRRERGAWRYVGGVLVEGARVPREFGARVAPGEVARAREAFLAVATRATSTTKE